MKLEDIGFYTLSDTRARQADIYTPLHRCELLLTSRCNFKCPYCRRVGGADLELYKAKAIIDLWKKEGLLHIRFSGGEPTLYRELDELVAHAKRSNINRIALSTNGSAPLNMYKNLIHLGVNDFSISLDACCASGGNVMSGVSGKWDSVVANIEALSKLTYVTVGIVLTETNVKEAESIIKFSDKLGIQDIRIIPAAQCGKQLSELDVPKEILDKYPILAYRINNIKIGKNVRGLSDSDSKRCPLVLDDMAVAGNKHYPCIIYLREGGAAIGEVGPHMRLERREWMANQNTHENYICKNNCLDVCVDYNNKWRAFHK